MKFRDSSDDRKEKEAKGDGAKEDGDKGDGEKPAKADGAKKKKSSSGLPPELDPNYKVLA